MKTVPTLRLVSKPEAPAELDGLGVDDLPAEVRLALTDIAGAAREGLLAMSVAAGMAVMRAMFDAEITAVCGPRGKHDPDRAAVRHGAGRGSVVLGGRRVPVSRPRARTTGGGEVPLAAYRLFAAEDQLHGCGDGADAGWVGHPPPRRRGRTGRRGGAEAGNGDQPLGGVPPVHRRDEDRPGRPACPRPDPLEYQGVDGRRGTPC